MRQGGGCRRIDRQKRRGVLRGTVGKPQPEGQELLRRIRILLTACRAFVESAPRYCNPRKPGVELLC